MQLVSQGQIGGGLTDSLLIGAQLAFPPNTSSPMIRHAAVLILLDAMALESVDSSSVGACTGLSRDVDR